MPRSFSFDAGYYQRHYLSPKTRAISRAAFAKLGNFVCCYLRYLDQPVRRVLDIGCGLGFWRDVLNQQFPKASYTGVELSEYLCQRFGWDQGSVIDYRSRYPFDLVICNDVLQYLTPSDASAAIENLARLCRGALFFGVLTKEDWSENCDQDRTDGSGYLRTGAWYRRRLLDHFDNAGGGLFVSHRSPVVLYDLEKLERRR